MNVTIRTAKLFLQGEEEATAIVYKSYRALLYFIIATYVDNKEDCDDVYQNVFMKILDKRSEVKDASSLHSSLRRNFSMSLAVQNIQSVVYLPLCTAYIGRMMSYASS